MPLNEIHKFWSQRQTGHQCERTHRLIDSFSAIKAKSHRQWLHDPLSAATVAMTAEGSQCVAAALNHILIDKLYDQPESKIVLEMTRLAEKPTREEKTPYRNSRRGCYVKKRY